MKKIRVLTFEHLSILGRALDRMSEITQPFYYTGLTKTATIREQEGEAKTYQLNREYEVKLRIHIPANSYDWIVIE